MPVSSATLTERKQNGAYYTDEAVARFLVRWALPSLAASALDPSCGDGVFLREAIREARCSRVLGIDIAASAVATARASLAGSPAEVLLSDFFELAADDVGEFDAVVGNPPFVRFHRFAGSARERALLAAQSAGVRLSALSSAWAPFLVHAVGFVKRGGRLAMVAPAELLHAAYARPVLAHLYRSFAQVAIITFGRRLFTDLSQDTVLLLCAGRGQKSSRLALLDLADQWQLETLLDVDPDLSAARRLRAVPLLEGRERALEYLLPEAPRRLYRRLRDSTASARLGDWATVGIGYVTGNNGYFHLSRQQIADHHLGADFVIPALRRADELKGLIYSEADWSTAAAAGSETYVVHLPSDPEDLSESAQAYIALGERQGVHLAYKCRVRKPWYVVPGLRTPDAFLTYMIHVSPRLVVNQAGAVAPNSLLVAHRKAGVPSLEYMCLALMTSLGRLSVELEGHSLGGGLLKLEPGEAARVVLPSCAEGAAQRRVEGVFDEVDALVREGRHDEAQNRADVVVLQQGLGLSQRECATLKMGWVKLQNRRLNR